jgi:hypothetical protein
LKRLAITDELRTSLHEPALEWRRRREWAS